MAALTACLAACGGNNDSPTQPVVKAIAPAVVLPASAASAPVVASAPVAQPASAPAVASAPVVASDPGPASTPIVNVDVFGDDQAMGIQDYSGMSYNFKPSSASLQGALRKQFNDTGITIANHASGGRAAALMNLLDGMDGGGSAQPARMAASGAKIAVEAHSINDFYGGETVEQYQADLIQWVEDAQASGITPVLQEPSPICDGSEPIQAQYVAVIDSVGAQLNAPVINLYSYVKTVPDWQSHMQGCRIPDAYLNQLEAQQAQAVIAPLVKTLIGE